MNERVARTFFKLAAEYIVLVLPVAIYAVLEVTGHKPWHHFLTTPEWSIATIFIAIQNVKSQFQMSRHDVDGGFPTLVVILMFSISLAAIVNAFMNLQSGPSLGNVGLMWVLYVAATLFFLFIAGAAKYREEHS